MPKINVNVNHSLDKNEATERIKNLLSKMKTEYGNMVQNLEENWTDNMADFSFKAMGMAVTGKLQVEDSTVILDGKIPLTALPFKKTIEDKISEEAHKLLN